MSKKHRHLIFAKVVLPTVLASGLALFSACSTHTTQTPPPERPFAETPEVLDTSENNSWVNLPSKEPFNKSVDEATLKAAYEEDHGPSKPRFEPYVDVTDTATNTGSPANKAGTSPPPPNMSQAHNNHQGDPPKAVGIRGSIDF